MDLILFGYKGCGKTHFGKLVAQRLNLSFIDTDKLIENLFLQKKGQEITCREIFKEIGAIPFRALENEVIQALQDVQHSVIALGAGVVLDQINVDFLLPKGKMVYLELDKEVLKKRVLSGELPAYIDSNNPDASFDLMYEKRKPFYERVPAVRIDVTNKSDKEIVNKLCKLMQDKEKKLHGK